MSEQTRFLLNEADLPKFWYNVMADSPVAPNPVLRPDTLEPVTPDFLGVLFPMELIMQEVSAEQYIEIPEEVREIYKLYRPTPLLRARRLEKALGSVPQVRDPELYRTEPFAPLFDLDHARRGLGFAAEIDLRPDIEGALERARA